MTDKNKEREDGGKKGTDQEAGRDQEGQTAAPAKKTGSDDEVEE